MSGKIITHDSQRVNTRTSTDEKITRPDLSAKLRNLLVILYNLQQEYGFAFPSNAWLAKQTGCTERTITNRLKWLAKYGFISVSYSYNERHIRVIFYPLSIGFPNTKETLCETKRLNTNVIPKEKLEENKHTHDIGISQEYAEETPENRHIAPTLTSEYDAEQLNARGDASDSLTAELEGDKLIEKVIEAPSYPPTCLVDRPAGAPAETEATKADTILRGKERENAHDGTAETAGKLRHSGKPDSELSPGIGNASSDRMRDARNTSQSAGTGSAGENGRVVQPASNAKNRMGADTGSPTSSTDTLIEIGVDTAQAQRIASQHTQEAIARAIAYANQQEARKGRLTNKAGFIVSALSRQWGFKLLDISAEGIQRRQARLRVREMAEVECTGAMPPMALLRAKLGGVSA